MWKVDRHGSVLDAHDDIDCGLCLSPSCLDADCEPGTTDWKFPANDLDDLLTNVREPDGPATSLFIPHTDSPSKDDDISHEEYARAAASFWNYDKDHTDPSLRQAVQQLSFQTCIDENLSKDFDSCDEQANMQLLKAYKKTDGYSTSTLILLRQQGDSVAKTLLDLPVDDCTRLRTTDMSRYQIPDDTKACDLSKVNCSSGDTGVGDSMLMKEAPIKVDVIYAVNDLSSRLANQNTTSAEKLEGPAICVNADDKNYQTSINHSDAQLIKEDATTTVWENVAGGLGLSMAMQPPDSQIGKRKAQDDGSSNSLMQEEKKPRTEKQMKALEDARNAKAHWKHAVDLTKEDCIREQIEECEEMKRHLSDSNQMPNQFKAVLRMLHLAKHRGIIKKCVFVSSQPPGTLHAYGWVSFEVDCSQDFKRELYKLHGKSEELLMLDRRPSEDADYTTVNNTLESFGLAPNTAKGARGKWIDAYAGEILFVAVEPKPKGTTSKGKI